MLRQGRLYLTEYEITFEFYQREIYQDAKVFSEVYHANYLCYKLLAMLNTFV